MFEDYYKILGIDYHASPKAIQKAFHKLAKELHPDKNPNNTSAAEKFKKISEAYVVLSDPQKKSQYDLKLRYGAYAAYLSNDRPDDMQPEGGHLFHATFIENLQLFLLKSRCGVVFL